MNKGFTLIELLVVVLIIGILTAIAIPQYTTAVERSRGTEALTLMSAITGAVQRFRIQRDTWPTDNDFNRLDIEVPLISGTTNQFGGTNFQMTMESLADDGNGNARFLVRAARRVNNSQYFLKTIVTEQTNGTFSTTRCCTATQTGDTCTPPTDAKAMKYCSAISNGTPASF